jgi:hypothetical protein
MTRQIQDFFSGLQNTMNATGLRKKEILEAVQEVTAITLTTKQIQIKNKSLFFTVKPLFREVILHKKTSIVERITEKTGIVFTIE